MKNHRVLYGSLVAASVRAGPVLGAGRSQCVILAHLLGSRDIGLDRIHCHYPLATLTWQDAAGHIAELRREL